MAKPSVRILEHRVKFFDSRAEEVNDCRFLFFLFLCSLFLCLFLSFLLFFLFLLFLLLL